MNNQSLISQSATRRYAWLHLLFAILFVFLFLPALAHAALSIVRTSANATTPKMYIDNGTQNLFGAYQSYKITSTTAENDIWVKIDTFSGGVVGLATNEDGVAHLGSFTAGQTKAAFFYLGATGITSTAQSHFVRLYDRSPNSAPPPTPLLSQSFSISAVETTITASANKVNSVTVSPNPPALGGSMTITVVGDSGTIGAAGHMAFTPSAALTWPADKLKLVSTSITLDATATTFTDQLYINNTTTTSYTAVYNFKANGTTSSNSINAAVPYISSGAAVKHNDATAAAGTATITQISNTVTLAKSANPTTLGGGSSTTYTATATNTSTASTTMDDFVDTLPTAPAAATYVTGSSQFNGVAIADPFINGAVASWFGTFTVPASGSSQLTYQVAFPSTTGSYTNSVVGHIGSAQIDTTVSTSDNAPATATVMVLSPPTITKAFSLTTIGQNQTTILTITLSNSNTASTITGAAFTDTYPANVVNTSSASGATTCTGGTVTAANNGTSVALSGGTIPASGSCTVTVNVTSAIVGTYNNTIPIGGLTTTNAGANTVAATATLTVVSKPTISKSFSPASIALGATSTITFTITNSDPAPRTGMSFTDTYPVNLVNATPMTVGGTCASVTHTAVAGGGTFNVTAGNIPASGSCTVTVVVTSSVAGNYDNQTSGVATNETGSAGATGNVATLSVVGPPSIAKSFTQSTIGTNGTSVLTLTITNPNPSTVLTGIAVSDTYPSGLVNTGLPSPVTTCASATITGGVAGENSIGITGGSLTPTDSCTVTVNVTSATVGSYPNTTGAVSSTNGGTGNTASATLTVNNRPTVSKSFSPVSVGTNDSSLLTITLSNSNATALTFAAFTDTYPVNLVNTSSASGATTCTGGTVTAANNGTSVALSGGTIPASGSCTVTVNVTSSTAGSYVNTIAIGGVTTSNAGSNTSATSATLTVLARPTVTKSFSPVSVNTNAASVLTITLSNSNATDLTAAAFTDTYPANLVNTGTPSGATTCTGGTVTAAASGTSLALSGGTIPASGSCTVTVNVTSATAASYVNTIPVGGVTTGNGGSNSSAAIATLTVVAPPPISITKTTSTPSSPQGGQASYTITITNTSNAAVTGVTVNDPLPAGFFFATTTAISGNATRTSVTDPAYGDASPTWGTFTIPATTGTLTMTFTANIGCGTTTGVKDNSVSVSGTGFTTVTFDGTGSTAENVTVTAAGAGTMTVNGTADTNTRDTALTLREAIMLSEGTLSKSSSLTSQEWNQVAGCPGSGIADTVNFSAALGTITIIGSVLPSVTDAAGTIITGIGSTVQLSQTGLSAGSNGLTLTNGANKVLGMIIRDFPNAGVSVTGGTNKIFHNTLQTNGTGVIVSIGVTGLDLRNNLITNNTVAGVSAASSVGTIDYNGYFNNGSGGNVHCTGGCTIGANSIKADPRYTNTGAGDFTLLASSPAIDRGLDLGIDQPDVNGASAGNFNSTAPDMGARESSFSASAAAASVIAELIPITVYYTSTGIPFTWDTLPTISSTQSGVDRITLTIPTGFSSPAVTAVTVSGISLTLGTTNCTAPNLPATGEYCVSVAGTVLTVTSGLRVIDTTSNKQITIGFTLSAPGVTGFSTFTATVADTMTGVAAVTATAGNANGTAGNAITDNDTLTVETVDRVIVKNNNDTTNGNVTSAWMLVSFPGTDGISLREAITATQVGGSANNNPVPEIIVFNTTVFPPNSQTTITPLSQLPTLTDSAGTIIDAFTAPYLAGVLLDGTGLSATTNGLLLSSNNNIVRNLNFQNFGFGVQMSAGFSFNEVSKNLINNARTTGILINGGTSHTIKENTVAASNGDGIGTTGSPTSLTIRDNIVSSSKSAGIRICCTSPANNLVIGNQVTSNAGAPIQVSGGSGNTLDSNTALNNSFGINIASSVNAKITKNLISGSASTGMTIDVGSTGATVTLNTIRNNTSMGIKVSANTAKIFNNTINGNARSGIEVLSSVTGFDIRNNILSNNTQFGISAPAGSTINFNDYFNNTSGACGNGCAIGANSITTDPLYVNPSSPTFDFHLQEPNSPAINTGVDLGLDQPDLNGAAAGNYNGSAPDMGAYESTVSGTPPALSLTVSTSSPSVLSGGSAIYTITLTNTGGTVANGVVTTATLPSGFAFLSGSSSVSGNATRSPGTPDPAGGESAPQWGTFSIPATTGQLTITFQAGIDCTVAAGIYNTSGSATSSNTTIPSYNGTTGTLDDVSVAAGNPIIVVSSIGDGNVRDSVITLREAILLANGTLSTQVLTAAERNLVSGCVGAGIRETINFSGGVFPSATPGTILISGSSLPALTDAAGVLFDGFGKGVIIDGGNTGTLIGLTLASNTNFLRGFTVQRFVGTSPNGVGILLSTASTNTLTSVTSQQNGTTGIFVSGGSGNTLTSVTTTLNGTFGIDVTGANTTMTSITATSNLGGGIRVATGNTNTIATSTISSNTGIGVEFGSNANALTGSTLNANTTTGVLVSGATNTVSTNTITNAGTDGLSISGNSNTAIATNTITGSAQSGLLITGSTNTATGNTISTNGTGGVLIQTGTGNTVTGGTINGNTGQGVRIESNSNTISSATISSNTTGGAVVTGSSNSLTALTMATNTGIGVEFVGGTNTLSSSTITAPTSLGVRAATGTGNTVSATTIDSATGAGVQFESSANTVTGGTIKNTIAGPGVSVLGGAGNTVSSATIQTNAGAGILMTGGTVAIINLNRIAANTGAGIDIAAAATGSVMTVNTINGNTGNGVTIAANTTTLFNNTVSHNSGGGVAIGAGVIGFDIRNNQFTFNTGAGINAPAGGTMDYNNTYGNTPSGLCIGGCALGVNAIKADPRYASPGTLVTSSFALNAASPAINRGLDLGASQPDLNGASAGNFNATAPDIGAVESSFSTPAVATSAIAELVPITVYFGSSGIPFIWESQPTLGVSNSGVDRVNLTLPAGYAAPAVTSVTVSGTTLTLGTSNCAPAFLPEPGEYCTSVTGLALSVIFSNRVLDTTANRRITVNFTLTVPTVKDAGLVFGSNVDDQMTSSATVSAAAGNVNGTVGNGITDGDTLTVTTVDTVMVRNTTDTVNGDVSSAWMLVPFPGSDGISLREAMTAVNAGVSAGVLDAVNFDPAFFPPAAPATIMITSALPDIADVAGTNITALNPVSGVVFNGAGLVSGAGLTLAGGTNRISGLEIKNFPGNGITISGGASSIIESSLIRSNGGAGVFVTGSNNRLLHNTINGNTGNGITNTDGTTEIKNSLMTNNAGFGISSPAADIDYSGFFGNASGDCTGGCAIGAASLPFDPIYTNAATFDFTLQSTSPMINMGIDLGGSQPDQNGATAGLFNGNFPDIGRFETATGTTNPSVTISKTTSTPTVNGGGQATYTITLTNAGARGARGIAVTDTLPAGFTYTATSVIGGSAMRTSVMDPTAGTGILSWAGWFIPQGGGTLTITFTAAAPTAQGTYNNNVSAISIDVTISSFTGAPVQVLGFNVSGIVFSDVNRNGALDLAETGIISVTVKIFAMPANSLVATQTTNSAGSYIFAGIANGSYEIRETVPVNYTATTPTILAITINNAHITGQNFGNFAGTKITGLVFLDIGSGGGTPNNGLRDGGESGINAVAVKVTDTGGGTIYDQTVTSQTGAYTLWVPTASPLSVVVRETNPINYISTTPDTLSLSASPGIDLANNNFGDVPPLSLSPNGNQMAAPGGVVMFAHTLVAGTAGQITLSTTTTQGFLFTFYKDTNGNGQIDAGEPILTSADLNLTANQTLKFVARTMIPSNKPLGLIDTTIITALQSLVNSSLTDTRTAMDVTTVSTGTLRLIKSGSTTTAKPGDTVVYTLAYTNIGAQTLSSIVVYDRLSEYLLFVSAVPAPDAGFPDTAGVLRWTIAGTLSGSSGGSLSYTVTVR